MNVASIQLDALTPKAEAAVVLVPETFKVDVSPDLQALATKIAKEHGLNVSRFLNVINCESQWNPDAIGDHGKSFGLVQIHLPSHPEISKKQALDPTFSIEWAAQRWEEGDAWMWSCYKILGYRS